MTSKLLPLSKLVDHAIANVDSLYNSQKSIANRNESAPWKDESLTTSMGQLKVASECVSDSMTKLTLICSKYPEQIESLLPEVSNHVNVLIHIYCGFTELKSCQSLFLSVSHSIKTLLLHIQELIQMLIRQEFDQCSRSGTGMIWKAVKEISELPVTNKGSFRRDVMEDIATIADTIREFEGYVNTTNENKNAINSSNTSNSHSSNDTVMISETKDSDSQERDNGNDGEDEDEDGDDDDDNDDDDDEDGNEDENEDYSESELPLVHKSIQLIKSTADLLKFMLQLMTFISDNLCTVTEITPDLISQDEIIDQTVDINQQLQSLSLETNRINISSSSSSLHTTSTKTYYTTSQNLKSQMIGNNIGTQIWVSELIKIKSFLTGAVTDLGCELYPPVAEVSVATTSNVILHSSNLVIELLMIYEKNMTNEMKQSLVVLKSQFVLS